MAPRRGRPGLGGPTASVGALPACGAPEQEATPAADTGGGADAAPAAHAVTYVLGWETAGAERTDSGAWRMRTDLDYEVELRAGWLVSHSVQLVECPQDSMGLRVLRMLGIGVAYAGHGETDNPAEVYSPLMESLVAPARVAFGERPSTDQTRRRATSPTPTSSGAPSASKGSGGRGRPRPRSSSRPASPGARSATSRRPRWPTRSNWT